MNEAIRIGNPSGILVRIPWKVSERSDKANLGEAKKDSILTSAVASQAKLHKQVGKGPDLYY